MIFVIDIGNTNVSFAGIEGEEIVFTDKTQTNAQWDAAEYTRRIRPILGDPDRFEGAILSSVVPVVAAAVSESLTALMGKAPLVMDRNTRTGLILDLPEPDKVGRDRLVDAAWAAAHMSLPCVTADLGTATTLNVILPGNVFAGGIICAGIQTGLLALASRTAQLPKLELKVPPHVIGKNTEECMLSGAVAGTAGMLDGLVTAIEEELGTPVSLAITGGGGKYVSPLVRHSHIFDPDLTLKGLAIVYRANKDVKSSAVSHQSSV